MNTRKRNNKSIFQKVFIPIFCLMLLQSIIYFTVMVKGGTIDTLNENARTTLTGRVTDRAGEINDKFSTKWSKLSIYADSFDQLYEKYNKNSDVPMYESTQLQEEYLADVSGILVNMLRNNEVNGVFLILNNEKEFHFPENGETKENLGLCIRDYDQHSGYTEMEDLRLVRCPSAITADVGGTLETWWANSFQFNSSMNYDYYYKPLQLAYENPGMERETLAYFCPAHKFSELDKEVVSYSVPLIDKDGYPYGVLGIELTVSYLAELLPSGELNGNNEASYLFVRYQDEEDAYDVITYNGLFFVSCFGSDKKIYADEEVEDTFFNTQDKGGNELCAAFVSLDFYDEDTPLFEEELGLIGLVQKDNLYYFSRIVQNRLLIVTFLTLFIGIIGILVVCRYFAKPITVLAKDVRNMQPQPNFRLQRLGISEIDQLVTSIEDLSRNISENEARTEFFSRMSHDMRTPMNAIISYSSKTLLANADEKTKDEYLKKINTSGEFLLGLINEVLDMNKIEMGKMKLQERSIHWDSFLQSVVTIVERLALEKNVSFKMDVPGEMPEYLVADRQRLSQIVVNLLSNAVKFTDGGGSVEFNIAIVECTGKELEYKIVVKDTGIGMSEEFMESLYQPFAQENSGKEGTGLGLAITAKLVELMGGTIECKSQLGVGTEFTVQLRSKIGSPDEFVKLQNEPQDELHMFEGKRILLCEDHQMNQQITVRLLKSKGIVTEIAEDGRQGVEMFAEAPLGYYDGILMDIRMPNLNGLEAAVAIRAMDRDDAGTIPIIAMTANVFSEDVEETRLAGMNAHLTKPIEPDALFTTLKKLL